jgi:hypothetical protein
VDPSPSSVDQNVIMKDHSLQGNSREPSSHSGNGRVGLEKKDPLVRPRLPGFVGRPGHDNRSNLYKPQRGRFPVTASAPVAGSKMEVNDPHYPPPKGYFGALPKGYVPPAPHEPKKGWFPIKPSGVEQQPQPPKWEALAPPQYYNCYDPTRDYSILHLLPGFEAIASPPYESAPKINNDSDTSTGSSNDFVTNDTYPNPESCKSVDKLQSGEAWKPLGSDPNEALRRQLYAGQWENGDDGGDVRGSDIESDIESEETAVESDNNIIYFDSDEGYSPGRRNRVESGYYASLGEYDSDTAMDDHESAQWKQDWDSDIETDATDQADASDGSIANDERSISSDDLDDSRIVICKDPSHAITFDGKVHRTFEDLDDDNRIVIYEDRPHADIIASSDDGSVMHEVASHATLNDETLGSLEDSDGFNGSIAHKVPSQINSDDEIHEDAEDTNGSGSAGNEEGYKLQAATREEDGFEPAAMEGIIGETSDLIDLNSPIEEGYKNQESTAGFLREISELQLGSPYEGYQNQEFTNVPGSADVEGFVEEISDLIDLDSPSEEGYEKKQSVKVHESTAFSGFDNILERLEDPNEFASLDKEELPLQRAAQNNEDSAPPAAAPKGSEDEGSSSPFEPNPAPPSSGPSKGRLPPVKLVPPPPSSSSSEGEPDRIVFKPRGHRPPFQQRRHFSGVKLAPSDRESSFEQEVRRRDEQLKAEKEAEKADKEKEAVRKAAKLAARRRKKEKKAKVMAKIPPTTRKLRSSK